MKKLREGEVKASEVQFPFDLYPRNQRDEDHVEQLAAAIKAGEQLPPVVVEEGSLRCADGWHRVPAHQMVYGEDCMVPCEFWQYPDDGFFFLHATRLNATHGLSLSMSDRRRCLVISKNLNVSSENMRRVLAITPEDAKRIMENGYGEDRVRPVVPLGREYQYLGRRSLNKSQAKAVKKLTGKGPLHHADQLITLMEEDLMPEITVELGGKLSKLKNMLEARGY